MTEGLHNRRKQTKVVSGGKKSPRRLKLLDGVANEKDRIGLGLTLIPKETAHGIRLSTGKEVSVRNWPRLLSQPAWMFVSRLSASVTAEGAN